MHKHATRARSKHATVTVREGRPVRTFWHFSHILHITPLRMVNFIYPQYCKILVEYHTYLDFLALFVHDHQREGKR